MQLFERLFKQGSSIGTYCYFKQQPGGVFAGGSGVTPTVCASSDLKADALQLHLAASPLELQRIRCIEFHAIVLVNRDWNEPNFNPYSVTERRTLSYIRESNSAGLINSGGLFHDSAITETWDQRL